VTLIPGSSRGGAPTFRGTGQSIRRRPTRQAIWALFFSLDRVTGTGRHVHSIHVGLLDLYGRVNCQFEPMGASDA
jgi:hypothetical protein